MGESNEVELRVVQASVGPHVRRGRDCASWLSRKVSTCVLKLSLPLSTLRVGQSWISRTSLERAGLVSTRQVLEGED
jgi:hypothetical protein